MTMTDPSLGTVEQRDAYATLMQVLQQYGLDDLASWAWNGIVSGTSSAAMQVDLYNQPAFQQRFWVIFQRQEAGLPPISPIDVLNYENGWSQIAVAAGLPPSFATSDVAQQQMALNRSLIEAKARVDEGFVTMHNAPEEVKAAFGQYFGVQGDAALAAFFIDDQLALPDLERMVMEAQDAGAAAQHGFTLQESMADQLARMGIGYAQAQTGFSQLDQQRHLFEQTIGEAGVPGSQVTAETGIEAQFGLSGQAAEDVARLADQRKATYSGSSDAMTTQEGITGLGGAKQT